MQVDSADCFHSSQTRVISGERQAFSVYMQRYRTYAPLHCAGEGFQGRTTVFARFINLEIFVIIQQYPLHESFAN